MYERFTDRARKVMQLANQEAQRFNHEYIGTEHLLLGLIREGSGVAANVLKNLDIDLRRVRREIEKIIQPGPDLMTLGKLPQTPRVKKVIEYGVEEARSLNHNYIGTEHLLLGLIREQEGIGAQVLMALGLDLTTVRTETLNLLGHQAPLPQQVVTPPRERHPVRVPPSSGDSMPWTDRAQKAMQLANQEAQRLNHEYIGTQHVLLGLVKEGSDRAAAILKGHGVDLDSLRREVEKVVQPTPHVRTLGSLPNTPRVKKAVEHAVDAAHELRHPHVSTEHLLFGLLAEEEGVAAQVLLNLGLDLENLRGEALGHGFRKSEATGPGPTFAGPERCNPLRALARQLKAEVDTARAGRRVVATYLFLFTFGFGAALLGHVSGETASGEGGFVDAILGGGGALLLTMGVGSCLGAKRKCG